MREQKMAGATSRPRRWAGWATPILAVGLLSAGNVSAAGPAAADPWDKLNVWNGHWLGETEYKDTAYSKAAHARSDVQCGWSPDHGYMVCEYKRIDGRPSDHLSIFTYNQADRSYRHTGLSQDYKPLEQLATINGTLWMAPFEDVGPKGEKVALRNVWEFVSPDRHIARQEYSTDGGQHWTVLWEQVATKAP
jgi:hypothetical protein